MEKVFLSVADRNMPFLIEAARSHVLNKYSVTGADCKVAFATTL